MDTIGRYVARQCPKLWNFAFKRGVRDAYEDGSEHRIREYLEHVESLTHGEFCLLDNPDVDMGWREWRHVLTTWCRYAQCPAISLYLLERIQRVNHLWCFLTTCMDMYIMGVKEWLVKPDPYNIENFAKEYNMHWTTPVGRRTRKMEMDDWISYLQDFVYARIHRECRPDEDEQGTERELGHHPTRFTYEAYSQEMWTLTRPESRLRGDFSELRAETPASIRKKRIKKELRLRRYTQTVAKLALADCRAASKEVQAVLDELRKERAQSAPEDDNKKVRIKVIEK